MAITLSGNGWIPEEEDSQVSMRVNQSSATLAFARHTPMGTDLKNIPRSMGLDVTGVAKSAAYDEDTSTRDTLILVAKKAGARVDIADEDNADSQVNVVNQSLLDWAISYAKYFDNATLAVTAAESGATVPYTSVYKAVRTTNATTDYTADDNYVATATGSALTYDDLSEVLGKVETGDYFEDTATFVAAHPAFRERLRNIKDNEDMPVFVRGQQGDAGSPDTLFGHPIVWTLGAKTSAVATAEPEGNPILVVGNRNYLHVGDRSGPESMLSTENRFINDELVLKIRARKAFVIGHEKAFAVLELVA